MDWEALQNVVLDQEGQHVYRLRPDVNGVSHRLIVDIRLEEHVKKVTFRSGLGVKNQSKERLQLKLLDGKGCQASEIWTIGLLLVAYCSGIYRLLSPLCNSTRG